MVGVPIMTLTIIQAKVSLKDTEEVYLYGD